MTHKIKKILKKFFRNNKIKPTVTTKKYVESQIRDQLNKAIIYKAQMKIVEKTILDEDKKDNALKAVAALQEQIKAGQASLKAWEDYYDEL